MSISPTIHNRSLTNINYIQAIITSLQINCRTIAHIARPYMMYGFFVIESMDISWHVRTNSLQFLLELLRHPVGLSVAFIESKAWMMEVLALTKCQGKPQHSALCNCQ